MKSLTITRPDDWHLHLRDGSALKTTVPASAYQFGRAIVMPNLLPPITTVNLAQAYYQRIIEAIPADTQFQPLMTLYLTPETTDDTLIAAKNSERVYAVKLYPAGATTHSAAGITSMRAIYPALATMERLNLPLLIHGEVTDPSVDIFDREAHFIKSELEPIVKQFPNLKIVLEHITTKIAVDFVTQASANVAATITAHHLLANRNALFNGGLRPHYYCLPILKRASDQRALLEAATSGNPKFFLGTDSAPHVRSAKESVCGCAGIYTAPIAMSLYACAFEMMDALDKLEGFASFFGADFYGLARNTDTITLKQTSLKVPSEYPLGVDTVIPFQAEEILAWSVITNKA